MQHAILSAAAITIVLLCAASLVVWSRRDLRIIRAAAVPVAILAGLVSTIVVLSTLGNPVPLIGGVTAPTGRAPVLSVKAIKSKCIYLTLDLEGEPRLYWMPWSMDTAEALQEMFNDPNNAGVLVDVPPFEFSWDINPPTFQPLPQPKWLEDKPEGEAPLAPHFSA